MPASLCALAPQAQRNIMASTASWVHGAAAIGASKQLQSQAGRSYRGSFFFVRNPWINYGDPQGNQRCFNQNKVYLVHPVCTYFWGLVKPEKLCQCIPKIAVSNKNLRFMCPTTLAPVQRPLALLSGEALKKQEPSK